MKKSKRLYKGLYSDNNMDKKITNEEYFAKASNLISWIEATSTDIESVNDLRRSMVRAIDQYMLTDKSMPWGNINRNEMSKYFGIATSG